MSASSNRGRGTLEYNDDEFEIAPAGDMEEEVYDDSEFSSHVTASAPSGAALQHRADFSAESEDDVQEESTFDPSPITNQKIRMTRGNQPTASHTVRARSQLQLQRIKDFEDKIRIKSLKKTFQTWQDQKRSAEISRGDVGSQGIDFEVAAGPSNRLRLSPANDLPPLNTYTDRNFTAAYNTAKRLYDDWKNDYDELNRNYHSLEQALDSSGFYSEAETQYRNETLIPRSTAVGKKALLFNYQVEQMNQTGTQSQLSTIQSLQRSAFEANQNSLNINKAILSLKIAPYELDTEIEEAGELFDIWSKTDDITHQAIVDFDSLQAQQKNLEQLNKLKQLLETQLERSQEALNKMDLIAKKYHHVRQDQIPQFKEQRESIAKQNQSRTDEINIRFQNITRKPMPPIRRSLIRGTSALGSGQPTVAELKNITNLHEKWVQAYDALNYELRRYQTVSSTSQNELDEKNQIFSKLKNKNSPIRKNFSNATGALIQAHTGITNKYQSYEKSKIDSDSIIRRSNEIIERINRLQPQTSLAARSSAGAGAARRATASAIAATSVDADLLRKLNDLIPPRTFQILTASLNQLVDEDTTEETIDNLHKNCQNNGISIAYVLSCFQKIAEEKESLDRLRDSQNENTSHTENLDVLPDAKKLGEYALLYKKLFTLKLDPHYGDESRVVPVGTPIPSDWSETSAASLITRAENRVTLTESISQYRERQTRLQLTSGSATGHAIWTENYNGRDFATRLSIKQIPDFLNRGKIYYDYLVGNLTIPEDQKGALLNICKYHAEQSGDHIKELIKALNDSFPQIKKAKKLDEKLATIAMQNLKHQDNSNLPSPELIKLAHSTLMSLSKKSMGKEIVLKNSWSRDFSIAVRYVANRLESEGITVNTDAVLKDHKELQNIAKNQNDFNEIYDDLLNEGELATLELGSSTPEPTPEPNPRSSAAYAAGTTNSATAASATSRAASSSASVRGTSATQRVTPPPIHTGSRASVTEPSTEESSAAEDFDLEKIDERIQKIIGALRKVPKGQEKQTREFILKELVTLETDFDDCRTNDKLPNITNLNSLIQLLQTWTDRLSKKLYELPEISPTNYDYDRLLKNLHAQRYIYKIADALHEIAISSNKFNSTLINPLINTRCLKDNARSGYNDNTNILKNRVITKREEHKRNSSDLKTLQKLNKYYRDLIDIAHPNWPDLAVAKTEAQTYLQKEYSLYQAQKSDYLADLIKACIDNLEKNKYEFEEGPSQSFIQELERFEILRIALSSQMGSEAIQNLINDKNWRLWGSPKIKSENLIAAMLFEKEKIESSSEPTEKLKHIKNFEIIFKAYDNFFGRKISLSQDITNFASQLTTIKAESIAAVSGSSSPSSRPVSPAFTAGAAATRAVTRTNIDPSAQKREVEEKNQASAKKPFIKSRSSTSNTQGQQTTTPFRRIHR